MIQGQTVRVPNVERKMLDLFQLRKVNKTVYQFAFVDHSVCVFS